MTIHRVVVIAGLAVVLVAPVAMSADTQHSGATQHAGTQSKAAQGQGWKKGQGWDYFAAAFDANKDGKVSKEELLAKQGVEPAPGTPEELAAFGKRESETWAKVVKQAKITAN